VPRAERLDLRPDVDAAVAEASIADAPAASAVLWAAAGGGNGEDVVHGIATDSSGNSTVVGTLQADGSFGSTSLGMGLFVARLDPGGGFLWATSTDVPSESEGLAVAVDSAGNSYVAGGLRGEATFGGTTLPATTNVFARMFVAKLDKVGTWLWAVAAEAGPLGQLRPAGIAVDDTGSCTVTGHFSLETSFGSTKLTSAGQEDAFVARLDSQGSFLWAVSAGGPGSDHGRGVALDSAGNSHVTGSFSETVTLGPQTLTSLGARDVFVAKLNSTGTVGWAVAAGGKYADEGRAIALDGAGNSHVGGSFTEPATFGGTTLQLGITDSFVTRVDPDGNIVWATAVETQAIGSFGPSIAVDSAGASVVTGAFYGQATIAGSTLSAVGLEDALVVKLDPQGKLLWGVSLGGAGRDQGQAVAMDGAGNVHVVGHFTGTTHLGAATFTAAGMDVFVARINASGTP
jgi:hypothetical protein